MRKLLCALLIGSGLAGATAANAQRWGPYGTPSSSYGASGYGSADGVCSGRRAHMLEGWVDRKVEDGRMDPDRADRIHSAIDRLEDKARHECREGDWRAIGNISERYEQIGYWIRSAGDDGWRDRW
jgi:hypothetical protein